MNVSKKDFDYNDNNDKLKTKIRYNKHVKDIESSEYNMPPSSMSMI